MKNLFLLGLSLLITQGAFASATDEQAIAKLESISECPVVGSNKYWVVVDNECVDQKYLEAIEILNANNSPTLGALVKETHESASETIVSISVPPRNGEGDAEGYTGYVLKFKPLARLAYSSEERAHTVSNYTKRAIDIIKLFNPVHPSSY